MARATIRAAGETVSGVYSGGPYIDLRFGQSGHGGTFDVINVWDYAAGRARIPATAAAVRAALIEWRDEYGNSLAHDLAEYRRRYRL